MVGQNIYGMPWEGNKTTNYEKNMLVWWIRDLIDKLWKLNRLGTLRMQVVSIVFSTKEGGMENVATRKCDSKETVERYYTRWTDQQGKRRNEWSR